MIHLSWYPGPRIQKLLDGIQDFRIKCNTSSCNANNSHLASSKDITHVRNYGSDESPDLRHKSEINMDLVKECARIAHIDKHIENGLYPGVEWKMNFNDNIYQGKSGYLNIVKRGYRDCKLDKKHLIKALKP